MASLTPSPKMQFFDANGNPLAGGLLYTYASGTTTPLATYTDAGGGTPNANPIVLDSRGEASVWLGSSLYTLALKTSAGVLVWSADAVGGQATLSALAASSGSSLIGANDGAAGSVWTTVAGFITNKGPTLGSIAALKSIDHTKIVNAIVQGYYAAGDGGGGLYYYDSSDTTSADNGGTIIVATDGGRWKLSQAGLVTVEQFGAKGDWNGATGTDDYTPISSSLTALGYANLSDRRYKYGTAMTTYSKRIIGPGTKTCELYYSGSGVALSAGGSDTTPCHVEGFRLTGTVSATGGLVVAQVGTGCRRGIFRDLYVSGFSGTGVYGIDLAASLNNGIYYNTFEKVGSDSNAKGWRVYSSDGATNGYRCNSNTFTNCTAQSNTGDGFYINYGVGNTFVGCDREGNGGYGFNIDHTYETTVVGGYSENNVAALNKTANANGVHWLGGRVVDAVSGTTNLAGDWFLTNNNVLDASGNLSLGGGLALAGTVAAANQINLSGSLLTTIALAGAAWQTLSPSGSYNGQTGYVNMFKPLLLANSNASLWAGAGSPNGAVNGYPGAVYCNTSGGAATSIYVKESGSNTNTGWVGK